MKLENIFLTLGIIYVIVGIFLLIFMTETIWGAISISITVGAGVILIYQNRFKKNSTKVKQN